MMTDGVLCMGTVYSRLDYLEFFFCFFSFGTRRAEVVLNSVAGFAWLVLEWFYSFFFRGGFLEGLCFW